MEPATKQFIEPSNQSIIYSLADVEKFCDRAPVNADVAIFTADSESWRNRSATFLALVKLQTAAAGRAPTASLPVGFI